MASKANELFKSSELEEKRRIISILFPNLQMDAEKLVFSLRKPFDLFINLGERLNWLPVIDYFRTKSFQEIGMKTIESFLKSA
ncbi:MAG: hypothetical protein A2103_01700 [Gammaproteobacteria bacterium GWF2_41_13]|nr:MAG: hypothetical protein A2103_01700 [Gammaproteobacteria bacterium GWF2_41_13]